MATITLHNIRYEPGVSGARVWLRDGDQEKVVGGVFRTVGSGRWQAWYMGRLEGEFETEELAREVVVACVQADRPVD